MGTTCQLYGNFSSSHPGSVTADYTGVLLSLKKGGANSMPACANWFIEAIPVLLITYFHLKIRKEKKKALYVEMIVTCNTYLIRNVLQ